MRTHAILVQLQTGFLYSGTSEALSPTKLPENVQEEMENSMRMKASQIQRSRQSIQIKTPFHSIENSDFISGSARTSFRFPHLVSFDKTHSEQGNLQILFTKYTNTTRNYKITHSLLGSGGGVESFSISPIIVLNISSTSFKNCKYEKFLPTCSFNLPEHSIKAQPHSSANF